jgi:hypothetical protein
VAVLAGGPLDAEPAGEGFLQVLGCWAVIAATAPMCSL